MSGSPGEIVSDMTPISAVRPNVIIPQLLKDSSRVDVELLMSEFREELGPLKWEEYRTSLSRFLMGKLSRAELVLALKETTGLKGSGMRNHNTFVQSLLANSYRELPPGTESNLAKWNTDSKLKSKAHGVGSGDNRIYQDILSLPVRERRRIKDIAKEALAYMKQPLLKPLLPTLIETRRKLLPHIPQDTSQQQDPNNPIENLKQQELNSPNPVTKAIAASKLLSESKKELDSQPPPQSTLTTASGILYDPVLNLHPAHTSGPLTWKQDIVQAFDVLLASENSELSDDSHLGQRMLGLSLENGLVRGVGVGAVDVMQIGVESYLRQILEQLVQMKHRKFSSEDPLTAEDLCLFADTRPSDMGEISGPLYRLRMNYLQNDDDVQHVEEGGDTYFEPGVSTDAEENPLREREDSTAGVKRYCPLDFLHHQVPTAPNRRYTRHQREIIEREIKQRAAENKQNEESKDVPKLKIKLSGSESNPQPSQKEHVKQEQDQSSATDLNTESETVSQNAVQFPELSKSVPEQLEILHKQQEETKEVWTDTEPEKTAELKAKVYKQQLQGLSFVRELL